MEKFLDWLDNLSPDAVAGSFAGIFWAIFITLAYDLVTAIG